MTAPPTHMVHAGRVAFRVPASLKVASRSHRMSGTYLETVVRQPRQDIQDVLDEYAGMYFLSRLKSDPPQRLALAPGTPALLFPGSSGDSQTLLAVSEQPDHALCLLIEFPASSMQEVRDDLRTIAGDYVRGSARGFCLEHGSIASLERTDEQASVSLVSSEEGGSEIDVSTVAVGYSSKVDELEATESRCQMLRDRGATVSIIENRRFVAAGVEGSESQFAAALADGSELVRYDWSFPGIEGDPRNPRIDISGFAPLAERETLHLAWNCLLGTLRLDPPRPSSTSRLAR